ncbi:nucleotidyltransferase [Paucilactobacillus kaifaensis]|uniref:nucleotidyltransferase n=1 Tax=Paucilactobacillus kaifaensis TaxID=2559921 RepID=UPI0010F54573|nr:nucleotidyltransferase [Paucilactobacillus kaifaensis]
MKAVGLVTEYNPLHNGHEYHLKMAKQLTNDDVVVAVMSGNFTQRAEPAIVDKWTRAREALMVGVDLVIELPVYFAVQPAHLFAKGAVKLLSNLRVNDFVFGAEHPDWDFEALVKAESKFKPADFSQFNATYATLFNEQLKNVTGVSLTEPNDILAYGYTKAKLELDTSINMWPIRRVGSAYHDQSLTTEGNISSASAIRKSVSVGNSQFEALVPEQTRIDLRQLDHVSSWDDLYPLLRYQLVQAPLNYLAQVYQMAEGLEYRLKRAAEQATDFDQFMQLAKSKRYTYSRLQRVCLYTLLQVTDTEMAEQVKTPYLRVLGFNNRGQEYLHQIKKTVKIPIVTKVDADFKNTRLQLDYRAGKLFEQLVAGEQDLRRKPIMI